MKLFSANYSNTNHNFVIQNLDEQRKDSKYIPAICILKNILQRGKPTSMSTFLQKELGAIHKEESFEKPYPLIDTEIPNWERMIRGDTKSNYFPAKFFYETLITKYLPDYTFIQQLIIPEIPLNEITMIDVDEFRDNQVDFYLPQAYLIIEIDGSQHKKDVLHDNIRDEYAEKNLIKTIRIKTEDIRNETPVLFEKFEEIKKRIETIKENQKKRRDNINDGNCKTFISIEDYQKAFLNKVNLNNSTYISTAIIRFQLLILELLETGRLDFSKEWNFELIERDVNGFAELAIKDLFIWFEHLFALQKIDFNTPNINIDYKEEIFHFSINKDCIKIDFSLLKRYTDEFQKNTEVIFVRNSYLDEYMYLKAGNSTDKMALVTFEQYDYFSVSTSELIKYKLKFGGNNSDEQHLLFFAWNLFLQNYSNLDYETLKFREGQLPIIENALSRKDTIGLLPTGSGKSICYQLSIILQPAISFVVCPIKSLMFDQKYDLDTTFFTRSNHISSDDDSEDKEKIQYNFGKGKYQFIFISPERFQIKEFRTYLEKVNEHYRIAYAVIDEAHCLSEWGHDFRTSYLQLANTIKKTCSNYNFIGLTATASVNVLKDIQVEFDISQENVKTPLNYSREELEFLIIESTENKSLPLLLNELKKMDESDNIFSINGDNSKCGIIFTPFVNGDKGCHQLSKNLTKQLKIDVRFFSGQIPKENKIEIMSEQEFKNHKLNVQDDFKKNKYPLLTATKAFGMGVNKGNIHYTFHYGIPSSMESLYQEAGRAGRDKKRFINTKAKCFVIFTKTTNESDLEKLWERKTTIEEMKELQKNITGDIKTNLYLSLSRAESILKESESIKKFFDSFAIANGKKIKIRGTDLKAKTETIIYRLFQLGIIEDWTISKFFGNGEFEVDFSDYSNEKIEKQLYNTISKYDKTFSLDQIGKDKKYAGFQKWLNDKTKSEIEKYILILLQWSYDNFAYNRRQSLKNIYENCSDLTSKKITGAIFKERIENYFKFTETTNLLQHVAEYPKAFNNWFDVFYQISNNKQTTQLITNKEQEALKDNLSRILESYMYSPGLDIISGLTRLMLDDYENLDGRQRFEGSLEFIKKVNKEEQNLIIDKILKIGTTLDSKNKNLMSESMCKYFNTPDILIKMAKSLGDTTSYINYIKSCNTRLKSIKKENN